jgi:hypothetical protein
MCLELVQGHHKLARVQSAWCRTLLAFIFVRRETTAGEDFSAMGALCRRIAALFYVIIKAADLDPLRATMFSVLASYLQAGNNIANGPGCLKLFDAAWNPIKRTLTFA